MAHSGRERHRDRELRRREPEEEPRPASRLFRITQGERQKVARYLRIIDDARRELESQHNAANRRIVRDLKAAADQIFELLNNLDETVE